MELEVLCSRTHDVKNVIGNLSTEVKNRVLHDAAKSILAHQDEIIAANAVDLENGRNNQMPQGLLDRLMLNPSRIAAIADGLDQVAGLNDPLGEILSETTRPNGLILKKVRVSIGVVGMIYEARPNVSADAFGLCFKTGNCVILKGGKDAIHSNIAIVNAIKEALKTNRIPEDAVNLITQTDRETTTQFMKMNQYVDVLIPRGGAGLISAVVNNSSIPVIETGTGNCHVYVDESADFEKTLNIIENAKTQRIGVCNAIESLVIHESVANEILPQIYNRLESYHVQFRCDEKSLSILSGKENVIAATEEDFGKEYLDYILSVKIVDSIDEAIAHINHYNTGHSETIMTENSEHADKFMKEIDAACVYHNASTRFSDGNEFGFGAEIGISTQKLHARGPMGLEALTSYKYLIFGDGQVRP